jgi:GDP-L-fucose synthase
MTINLQSRIYVAGHKGFVGNAVYKKLKDSGYKNIIIKNRDELDLLSQSQVECFFSQNKIDYVILCAAKVGGIAANIASPASFLYENLQIQNNIIHAAYKFNATKLIFLASSCIYPRNCPQPMREEYLFQGDFEPTNYGYAVAKAAGVKMCQAYNEQHNTNFVSINPSNLYGPGDNFDPKTSHAMAALIRKVAIAKQENHSNIVLWGDGLAKREWLFIDDLAEIIVKILDKKIAENILNIGTGKDLSMMDLIKNIAKIANYNGDIILDKTKPNGMPRKVMEVSKMPKYNLAAKTNLEEGIIKTYEWLIKRPNLCVKDSRQS